MRHGICRMFHVTWCRSFASAQTCKRPVSIKKSGKAEPVKRLTDHRATRAAQSINDDGPAGTPDPPPQTRCQPTSSV